MVSASGPEAVEMFRLIVLRSGLKMQAKGITVRRGANCRVLTKKLPGCPRTNNFGKLLDFLDEYIEEKAKNPLARFERI